MQQDNNKIVLLTIPALFIGIFATIAAVYVALMYQPTIEVVIDNQQTTVSTPYQASVEVYNHFPFEATFKTESGRAIKLDLRHLGLTYFKEEDIRFLDHLVDESFLSKLTNFIGLRDHRSVHVARQNIYLEETQVRDWISKNKYVLEELPVSDTLYASTDKVQLINGVDGFRIEPESLVQAIMSVKRTAMFEDVPVVSEVLPRLAPAEDLSAYNTLVSSIVIPIPETYVHYQNLKVALRNSQNVFVHNGEEVDLARYLGDFTLENGYLYNLNNVDNTQAIGGGVELFVDGMAEVAREAQLNIVAYKGESFQIGEDFPAFTGLKLRNESGSDLVISTLFVQNKLSIVIAKKG